LSRLRIAVGVTVLVPAVLRIKFSFGSLWRIPWVLISGAEGICALGRVDFERSPGHRAPRGVGDFSLIDRSIQNDRLNAVSSPPSECRSFFVIDGDMLALVPNIDAMNGKRPGAQMDRSMAMRERYIVVL